jgi:hypothetical protein
MSAFGQRDRPESTYSVEKLEIARTVIFCQMRF